MGAFLRPVILKEEDLKNRRWFTIDPNGKEIIHLGRGEVKVSEGKGELSFTHNYLRFWLLHGILQRVPWEVFWFYYQLISKHEEVEPEINKMILKCCGILPWSNNLLKIAKKLEIEGENFAVYKNKC